MAVGSVLRPKELPEIRGRLCDQLRSATVKIIPGLPLVTKIGRTTPTAIVLLLILIQPSYAPETREGKRILVLFREDKDHPAHL